MTGEKYASERMMPSGGARQAPRGGKGQRVLDHFEPHAVLVRLGREQTVLTADGAARARSRTVGFQKPADILALVHEGGGSVRLSRYGALRTTTRGLGRLRRGRLRLYRRVRGCNFSQVKPSIWMDLGTVRGW